MVRVVSFFDTLFQSGPVEIGTLIVFATALLYVYRYLFVGDNIKKAPTTKRASSASAPKRTQKVPLPLPFPQPTEKSPRELQEETRRKEREWVAAVLPKKAPAPSPKATKAAKAAKATKESKVQEQPPPLSNSPAPFLRATPKFAVGDNVTVAFRSEKGEPIKPGGEARVTKVELGWFVEDWLPEDKKTFRYNVSYVLGGREMGVAEKFISAETSLTLSTKRVRTPTKPDIATPGKKSKK
jgi:hypothetical protein